MAFAKKILPLAGLPLGLAGVAAGKGLASLIPGKKKKDDKPQSSLVTEGSSQPQSLIGGTRGVY